MLIFTKAFDSLVRQNIFYTLIHYGVRGEILNIIKSLYNNIKLRVKHNNELSEVSGSAILACFKEIVCHHFYFLSMLMT